MLLEIRGDITPERMKGWSQSKKQYPVAGVTGKKKARSNAVKSNIA